MPEKVVLAYSGGLDTSIIIPWLKENYSYNVIAMVGDVGQGDDIEAVVEKAYATGASKVVVEDLREEFLTGYVFPALRAGAVYEHKYLAGHIAGASRDRKTSSRSRSARGSDCRGARLHGQRERPGSFRIDLSGARAGAESDCAVAGVVVEIARGLSGLRRAARHCRWQRAARKFTAVIATCGTSVTKAENWRMQGMLRWRRPGR